MPQTFRTSRTRYNPLPINIPVVYASLLEQFFESSRHKRRCKHSRSRSHEALISAICSGVSVQHTMGTGRGRGRSSRGRGAGGAGNYYTGRGGLSPVDFYLYASQSFPLDGEQQLNQCRASAKCCCSCTPHRAIAHLPLYEVCHSNRPATIMFMHQICARWHAATLCL